MIAFQDDHYLTVSGAVVRSSPDPRLLVLAGVDDGPLLDYYFTQGKQRIAIKLAGIRLTGRLQTRWEGTQRRWFVRADSPAVLGAALMAVARDGIPIAGVVNPLPLAS
jgi:hypothetical protein